MSYLHVCTSCEDVSILHCAHRLLSTICILNLNDYITVKPGVDEECIGVEFFCACVSLCALLCLAVFPWRSNASWTGRCWCNSLLAVHHLRHPHDHAQGVAGGVHPRFRQPLSWHYQSLPSSAASARRAQELACILTATFSMLLPLSLHQHCVHSERLILCVYIYVAFGLNLIHMQFTLAAVKL